VSSPPPAAAPTLAKEIRLRDGLSLVVGGIIGSGIFFVPAVVSTQLTSLSAVLLVWVFGGLLSLAGALSLAELGAAMPRTGGLYVYLEEAYGPWAGFLYGWIHFTMTNSGTVATLGAAFALGVGALVPMHPWLLKAVGIASILSLTWFNYRGLKPGILVQNLFTTAKVLGLAAIVFLFLLRGRPTELWSADFWPEGGFSFAFGPFGLALVAVLWAYEGWHAITFSAGEFKNPQRDIPRSLAWGTLIVLGIYLVTNLAYFAVLTGTDIAAASSPATAGMTKLFGLAAAAVVTLIILTSVYGANNMQVLVGPRVMFAMAEEGLFFRAFSRIHPRNRTPGFSIWAQGLLASALTLVGGFEDLLNWVVFTHWIFYAATVAGVIVLRYKQPALERPFRTPLYPWLPLFFVVAAAGMIINNIIEDWQHSLVGIGIVLTGLPAYFYFRRQTPR
jgi:APA family basic amino acid/polyamine antiporter